MKHTILLITAMLAMCLNVSAQKSSAKAKTLSKAMTLKMDREGGANGASIAWHPKLKRYYAAMAGNKIFPMIIFDNKGEKVSDDELETMFDVRGFWYNESAKTFQANGYDDYGWGEYILDSKGTPKSVKTISSSTGQPDAQSVGAYNPKKNHVYFLNYKTKSIEQHNIPDPTADVTLRLRLGAANEKEAEDNKDKENSEEYNESSIIFTGIAKAEIGLLNVSSRRIELYDVTTGYMTQILNLPDDAKVESILNFTYCNNMYWLFNKSTRTWQGYK